MTAQPYALAEGDGLSNSSATSSNNLIINRSIFSLGKALIELSLLQRLTDLREDSDLDANHNPHPFTEHMTANRLLVRVKDREGEAYADIVKCCLSGGFSAAGPTLENNALQNQFYAQVVKPLLEAYTALK